MIYRGGMWEGGGGQDGVEWGGGKWDYCNSIIKKYIKKIKKIKINKRKRNGVKKQCEKNQVWYKFLEPGSNRTCICSLHMNGTLGMVQGTIHM